MDRLRGPLAFAWCAIAATALGAGCGSEIPAAPGGDGESPERRAATVAVYPASLRLLFLDDTLQLAVFARDAQGYPVAGTPVTWSTRDPAVAVVTARGLVTARGPGSTTVTATVDSVTGAAEVTVDPGIALQNDCMTCHWVRSPGGHFAWGFAESRCAACHATDPEQHTVIRPGHLAASGFALLGTHETLACASCHVPGSPRPRATPSSQNDCVACHRADYDRRHAGSGYPTTCLACHGTVTWRGATPLDHDAEHFPIYSGKHEGKWKACADCHVDPADFAVFSCFNCHRQDETNRKHEDVPGYRYVSSACLGCHPRGEEP